MVQTFTILAIEPFVSSFTTDTDFMQKYLAVLPEQTLEIALLVAGAMLLHQIAYRLFLPLFKAMARKTKTEWDDVLIQRKVINRIFHLLPATAMSIGLRFILDDSTETFEIFSRIINLYYIVVGFAVFDSLLNSVRDIYEMHEVAKRVSIRGFLQAFKVVALLFSLVLVVSQLAGKSPVYFLSGLGAFTAIILLIFKDPILGLVAGIQLTTMDLVRKGDWVEMPKHGADGDVVDISLTTVRIQNWDKTITAIPAYELVSSSFKNWRGMNESGGRRIMRSIHLDLNTVRFLKPEDLEHLRKIKLLRPYLEQKLAEIESANATSYTTTDLAVLGNGRRLTNVGTFRAYCVAYLKNHPNVHHELTFLIRQLQSTPTGLPLQIYIFANDVRWPVYEGIQADIFDHLFAILPEFGLRAYQQLSGTDVREAILSIAPKSSLGMTELEMN